MHHCQCNGDCLQLADNSCCNEATLIHVDINTTDIEVSDGFCDECRDRLNAIKRYSESTYESLSNY